jgi:hypothetical protein
MIHWRKTMWSCVARGWQELTVRASIHVVKKNTRTHNGEKKKNKAKANENEGKKMRRSCYCDCEQEENLNCRHKQTRDRACH